MRGPASNSELAGKGLHSTSSSKSDDNDSINRVLSCDDTPNTNLKGDNDGDTPIWKVGKLLMDSLSKGKMRRSKIFGVPLEDLPLDCQGIPSIVRRLCSHLEKFGIREADLFLCSKKQEKLIEKFKISFDRAGDAYLGSCIDIKVIGSLLKLWLQDLPHPLIPKRISSNLKALFEKYEREEVYDLVSEICNVLVTCPPLNLGVLYIVIRFLYDYVMTWFPSKHVDQIPEMFAKILIGGDKIYNVDIISTLVHKFPEIFNERVLERTFQLYIIRDEKTRNEDHKRNHLMLTRRCEYSPSAVDKLPRSNSEEDLILKNDYNQNISTTNLNIRRANSHEDFISHSQHNACRLIQPSVTEGKRGMIMNECLWSEGRINGSYLFEHPEEPILDDFQRRTHVLNKDVDVLVARPPFNYNDDVQIQEEIRNAERFNPRFTYRNNGRRKRTYQGYNVKQRNDDKEETIYAPPESYEVPDHWPENLEILNFYDLIRSWSSPEDSDLLSDSSTSSSSSTQSPKPETKDLHKSHSHLNPITSPRYRIFVNSFSSNSTCLPVSQEPHAYRENSNIPHSHLSNVGLKISQVSRHFQWIKRKMKHFEKDFEDKYGDIPVLTSKISHPEYKQMTVTAIYLKNYLKQLRREANDNLSTQNVLIQQDSSDNFDHSSPESINDKERAFQEAEKRLHASMTNERPEEIEDMNHDQLQNEKMSLQKELLYLESIFGQSAARNEKLFESFYLRYRNVKRFIARSSVSLKLKESVSSDLVTINENETMEFDSSPASVNSDDSISSDCQPMCNVSRSDFPVSNIHELSSLELMMEYKTTKEQKKKLRNQIFLYGQEFQNRTSHNSKHCIHSLRCRYKNTKAKLKLLEALLMKTK